MTERLYYEDAYLTEFTATVRRCLKAENGYRVLLDRSAFYPTSGGQPYDTGTLGAARVEDVWVDSEGEVWHLTDQALAEGETVTGLIDWARRFDHMQQHAGEHMIAGAIFDRLQGHTVGLHLGHDFSTIDVDLPGGAMRVPPEEIWEIEDTVNREIQQNLPIRCWFPAPEEFKDLPLRKPPTVKDHVRVVLIGAVECVACGGTHPARTGEIGVVKILDARPSKGKMRVSFVCGARAVQDYQMRFEKAGEAARLLSADVEKLPEAVQKLLDKARDAEGALNAQRREAAGQKIDSLLLDAAELPDGRRAVCAVLPGLGAKELRDAATRALDAGAYALLASDAGEGALLLFAAPEGAKANMGDLLRKVCASLGGKGGGRPDFAQGAAAGEPALRMARELLEDRTA